MIRRLIAGTLAAASVVAALATGGVPAAAGVDGTDFRGEDVDVTLRWRPCFQDIGQQTGAAYECATARVPLDYDKLDSGKIPLELVRLPATGASQGSLLLNPGGPGGSGIEFTVFAGPAMNPAIRENYDLIGFDPRGILRSNPLLCFGTLNASFAGLAPFAFPTNPAEENLWFRTDNFLRTQCANRGEIIINKMSSANVARDMEVLRAALGDEKLNFYGLSYGSVVGQVYAGLFPDRVGRLAIDGVIVMSDWVGDADGRSATLLDQRLESAAGAEDTWSEFHRTCELAGPTMCPMAPSTASRTQAVLDALEVSPLVLVDPSTGQVLFALRYSDLVGEMLGAMYAPQAWGTLALFFAELEAVLFGSLPPADQTSRAATLTLSRETLRATVGFERRLPPYPNFVEGFPGVTCVDTSFPVTNSQFAEAARAHSDEFPTFGAPWGWSTSVCKGWPGKDRDKFTGPFGPATENPILVMTTRYDPATSFEQAVETNALLPNSALVKVDGWGHTTLFTSTCADQILAAYFVDGALPADGTSCEPDLALPFQEAPDFGEPDPTPTEMARGVVVRAGASAWNRN